MLEVAATGFLLSLSLCLDLGVVNVAVIHMAVHRGARPALALGLGSALGDLIYAFLSVAAVTLVLGHRPVRLALWVGGTTALVWLAIRMIREALHPHGVVPQTTSEALRTHASHFARGVVLALASPSAILWFAAVGGSVIAASASGADALLPFMAGFVSAGVLWAVGVALLVGRARHAMGARAIRAISILSAAIFVYLAGRVFVPGYREFVG